MTWVRFEPTISVFERAKTVHALDCAVTVIGIVVLYLYINLSTLFLSNISRVHEEACKLHKALSALQYCTCNEEIRRGGPEGTQ
jgi:hypothetical protein